MDAIVQLNVRESCHASTPRVQMVYEHLPPAREQWCPVQVSTKEIGEMRVLLSRSNHLRWVLSPRARAGQRR